MASCTIERFKGLPFPQARVLWQEAAAGLPDEDALDIACKLARCFPDKPFFTAQVVRLAKASGQEVFAGRLLLDLAAVEPRVNVQHVWTAAEFLRMGTDLEGPEWEAVVAIRDRIVEASPQRHYFRAVLAHRIRDIAAAQTEIAAHLELFPDDTKAVVLRGTLAHQSGRWGEHSADLLALGAVDGSPRATELLNLFESFRAAQGLAGVPPEELVAQAHQLETPGAVYEYALRKSTPPDTGPRRGVVMLTGSLAGGGAERVVAMTYRRFREREHGEPVELWLFSITNAHAGDPLFYLPLTGASLDDLLVIEPVREQDEPFRWLPPFYAQRAQALYDHLVRVRPRVLYMTLDESIVAGGIAAIMAGVPEIILHCHNMSPPNLHGHDIHSYGWERVFRTLLARPNVRFINVAQAAVDDYLGWCRVDPAACHASVIHNGVDFSAMDAGLAGDLPQRIREELGIPLHSPVVGTAIRFTEVKQPLVWLDTARLIRDACPDAHFILYGDGVLLEAARARAVALGLADCVHFPGRVSDLAHRLPVFDIMMLSSRSEGFPNVLIEAQAAGVVPVAFDVGGCSETMDPGRTGLVVPEKTAAALAAEVAALLGDRRRLLQMKGAGQAFVRETFSIEQMMAALHDLTFANAPPHRASGQPVATQAPPSIEREFEDAGIAGGNRA